MKCRLCRLPLCTMHAAFAGDHSFTQQELRALYGPLLDEVVVLVDQDLADVIGIVEEDDILAANAVMRNIAIVVHESVKKRDRLDRVQLTHDLPYQVALRSRWKNVVTPPNQDRLCTGNRQGVAKCQAGFSSNANFLLIHRGVKAMSASKNHAH